MTVPLIEPKEISIESKIHGKTQEFQIGFYPALTGLELVGNAASIIKDGLANKSDKFGSELAALAVKICPYSAVKASNGDWLILENSVLINSHVADHEVLFQLIREIHDYNNHFLNSGELSKTSRAFLNQAKAQATKIFRGLQDSWSVKG